MSWFLPLFVFAQTGKNISLDAKDPIVFKGECIIYQGQKIDLNSRAFFVDGRMTDKEAEKYPYVFNSVNDALASAVNGSEAIPMTLYIAPNVYWIDDPDDPAIRVSKEKREPFGLKVKCSWLTLRGLTQDPKNVVLACNRGQMEGAVGNFTMFLFDGSDIRVDNMTLGNYCNVDLDYPLLSSLNRKKRMAAITQAQLAYCTGDRIEAHNVRFISRLNLCPLVGGKRTLFDRCYFESTDDALCGTGVYLNCEFSFYGSRPLYTTAKSGSVFLNCDFNVMLEEKQYLTKVMGLVMLVDCRFHSDHPVDLGWSPNPTDQLRCYQSNVSLNGESTLMNADKPHLTVNMNGSALLNAYKFNYKGHTIYNTYNLLRGDDDWDPMGVKTIVVEAERVLKQNLTNIPVCLLLHSSLDKIDTGKSKSVLNVEALRFGGYVIDPGKVSWRVDNDSLLFLHQVSNLQSEAIGKNKQDEDKKVVVTVKTALGLEAASVITVSPTLLESPRFLSKPEIDFIGKGRVKVYYTLNLGERTDQSLITWYRFSKPDGSDALPVAVSRLNHPEYEYELSQNDIGYYIMVTVAPKHARSDPGKEEKMIMVKPITYRDVIVKHQFFTDFKNFPTIYQPSLKPGFWIVDGYKPLDTMQYDWSANPEHSWFYGTGFDGARGTGLMQESRGARLLYTPVEGKYHEMKVILNVDPCKPAGQGFGSATGQYMDIYIKFDAKTLTGYALRIVRTTKHHNAVDFMLVEYHQGKVTPISDPVSTTCYRTSCTIALWTKGNKLLAHAETTAVSLSVGDPALKPIVDLEAEIKMSEFGGTGIQHTGSTGPSATMIHSMVIDYNP